MKKIVSLISVALFATVFAAGCGKFTKCDEAKTKSDCTKAKFEENKFEDKDGKALCEWKPNNPPGSDAEKDGKCQAPEAADPDTADKALCTAATTDTACTTASGTLAKKATHECKWTAPAGSATTGTCAFGTK